ncbi:hypothetical protein FisN_22Hh195 [Fistulifera solaris]|jgi:hypothetical protein|uniref:Uncharacterized protein n=1 Tax=Fistulifera solaris TaxID=1519565 RepID=A0A1Z5JPJ5_FISSO|nr:hypothetical protein FisN_22Hh195 [Fistulifera solaris]|eukprot:GAX15955.1 hypothetical protein FisN_22Hh195 [Fistulifera solaris]
MKVCLTILPLLPSAVWAFSSINVKPTPVATLDEAALLAQSKFPIAPADLIQKAKELLGPEIAIGTVDNGDCLAEDFEFCAPVIGPIGKTEFLESLASFKLTDSFDIDNQFFGFLVDPLQTNRVWFFSRVESVHKAPFMGVEATGKKLILPPQVLHMDFSEDGKIKEFGFYTVDRRIGNTGGLGGAFAYFYGVGKALPFPECQPYKPSKRLRFFSAVGRLLTKLKKSKSS